MEKESSSVPIKKYKVGFYGGKFCPLTLGHLHCLDIATKECEKVYLIMFINGNQELDILRQSNDDYLSIDSRLTQCHKAAAIYNNVEVRVIDVADCKLPNGEEDWDAETPLVLNEIGEFDAVYGSEPSYKPYFDRAYPNAVYRCIDPERKEVNISATKVRAMSPEERRKWMV